MNKDCALDFLFGICAGVAIGVLCAPKSGAKTRRLLAAKAQEGMGYRQEPGGGRLGQG